MKVFGYSIGWSVQKLTGLTPQPLLWGLAHKALPEKWCWWLFGKLHEYKGLALLKRILPEHEFARLIQYGFFYVHGSAGSLYRIEASSVNNIMDTDSWRVYCAAPATDDLRESLPKMDVLAAQALCLMNCEEEFLRVAFRFP